MQIKINYVILFCSIALTSMFIKPANAQVDRNYQFELLFSPAVTWLKSENTNITSGIKAGFSYGMLFDYNFGENYAFSTGLIISHDRGRFEDRITQQDSAGNTIYSSEEKFRLNYINIPISLKLKSNEIGYLTYWGKFGITPGIRIKARDTFKNPLNGEEIKNENIIKQDNPAMIKSDLLNLSLRIGLGIDLAISGNTKVSAGIVFNNGFLNILDDGDNEKTVIRSFGILTGLIF
ncbi:MAG: PorT family protein [Chitinophagales bacterium]|nr:PorT family protein [Chitinophagales bacterium]